MRTPKALATPAAVTSDGNGPKPPYMKTWVSNTPLYQLEKVSNQIEIKYV